MEVGTVTTFAGATIPPGWLLCNGQAISRNAYPDLFAKIGTTYGAGDGSTTFNMPNMYGQFLRGFDNGRGVDVGRVYGSPQASEIASHTHGLTVWWGSGGGSDSRVGFARTTNLYNSKAASNEARNTSNVPINGPNVVPINIAMNFCIRVLP